MPLLSGVRSQVSSILLLLLTVERGARPSVLKRPLSAIAKKGHTVVSYPILLNDLLVVYVVVVSDYL